MAMPLVDGAVNGLKKVQGHIDDGMQDILEVISNPGQDQDQFDQENVAALELVMLDYASMELKLKKFTAAVGKVKSQLQESTGGQFFDVSEKLEEVYNNLSQGESDQELGQHIMVKEFQEKLKELLAESEETEEEEEAGTSSAADQSMGEEELVMTQTEVGTKCPFTQREMTNPVKNTLCGHHYDAVSLKELLKKRNKIKCPLPGCPNTSLIQKDHLELDQEFKRRIDKQRKTNIKRRQADTMTK